MAAVMTDGRLVNGLDVDEIRELARELGRDPGRGQMEFRVSTAWKGQLRSRTSVDSYTIGGQRVHRHLEVDADEPFELLGRNTAANPQELLMAALNAGLTVGYVVQAALRGITLESLHIETTGALDLRGVLGLDPRIPPGFESIRYVARLYAVATHSHLGEVNEAVVRTSANYFNVSQPVKVDARLVVE